MATEFRLPELGENITSGDVVHVMVHEGDVVAVNQGIVELETDKAVIEIPCPLAGKIVKLHVAKGQRVSVGQALVTIQPEGATATPASGAGAPDASGATAGLSRATAGLSSSADDRGAGAAAGLSGATAVASRATAGLSSSAQPAAANDALLAAGPATRRLARQLGVDLAAVAGSGARGRITPEDVQAAASGSTPGAGAPASGGGLPGGDAAASAEPLPRGPVAPPGEPGSDAYGPVRRDRMSQIRRTIAARMTLSSSTIPHVTNFDDADVTELERIRKGVPEGFLEPGLKLSMLPLAMRAVAMALPNHPTLNATIDPEKEEIVYKQYVNLGVAVDTPRGLVVPVVRHAHQLSIGQLAHAVAELSGRARTAKFSLEDLRGGTFTLSNMGTVGGAYSTPIINAPEVAILLLGRSRWLPVVRGDKIEPRYMMPLSLSFDHRLVDGAAAARFLNEVIDTLQSPGRLLLGG